MKDRILKLFELSVGAKLGILAGSLAAVLLGYWVMFYSDVDHQLTNLSLDIDNLHSSIAAKRGLVARLPEAKLRVEKLDAALNKALLELPDKREIPSLLSRVSDKARDAGLDIRLFRPRGEQKRDFYAEVPVEVDVSGSYHQIASFFDEVGHLKRIVNLSGYNLREPREEEGEMVLSTTLTATAYRFLEEDERPAKNEKKKRKRRKRT